MTEIQAGVFNDTNLRFQVPMHVDGYHGPKVPQPPLSLCTDSRRCIEDICVFHINQGMSLDSIVLNYLRTMFKWSCRANVKCS